MALADYFHRSAVAAAQILSGFDEEAIKHRLENTTVGLVQGGDAQTFEGESCADLAVRILARLYPQLRIDGPSADSLVKLAKQVNPNIELIEGPVDFNLCIGAADGGEGINIYLGSSAWDAHYSPTEPQPIGNSQIAFGAGAAACLGAAAIFRAVFLDSLDLQADLTFSTLDLEPEATNDPLDFDALEIPVGTVLVGVGAIGHGVLWALSHASFHGELELVDPEKLDLGNLQRYVLGQSSDVDYPKVDLGAKALPGIAAKGHQMPWGQFVERSGYSWDRVLVALDSASDRRAVQSALPRWIANAWTQPGDFGVSVHPWQQGACLNCLYLPKGEIPSEDEQVALAFGLPERRQDIRRLLVGNEPTPAQLLIEAASALQIDPEPLMAFEGRPLRDIYVEGLCGGAAVPLDRIGAPAADIHVPLAHQSAMAGILLAARLSRNLLGRATSEAEATRIDLMRPLGTRLTTPIAKDVRGICICQDPIFKDVYYEKWNSAL